MKTFDEFLQENNGDHESAANAIHAELDKYGKQNATYRKTNGDLRTRVNELEGQVPGENTTILPKADADLLGQYRNFGTPDELRKLQSENRQHRRGNLLNRVAMAADLNADALRQLDDLLTTKTGTELEFEVREKKGENAKNTVVVKVDGRWVDANDYFSQTHSVFWPSLKPAQQKPKKVTGWIAQNRPSQQPAAVTEQNIIDQKKAGAGNLL